MFVIQDAFEYGTRQSAKKTENRPRLKDGTRFKIFTVRAPSPKAILSDGVCRVTSIKSPNSGGTALLYAPIPIGVFCLKFSEEP